MDDKLIQRMIQIGTVTAVDNDRHRARVHFLDTDISTDWMPVLNNSPYIPDYDGDQKTEEKSGGAGESAFASHAHNLTIRQWMPKINEVVLVLYRPINDSEGIVIGGIS